jgi:hypothetical protein
VTVGDVPRGVCPDLVDHEVGVAKSVDHELWFMVNTLVKALVNTLVNTLVKALVNGSD